MRAFIKICLGLCIIQHSLAKKRLNVVTHGTTLGPNFIINEGKYATVCPASHPWALNNGLSCCSTFERVSDKTKLLSFSDPVNECANQDVITCPIKHDKTVCRGREVKAVPCGDNFAYYPTQSGCCQFPLKENDSSIHESCDGTSWKNGHFKGPGDRDLDVCCPEAMFYPVPACEDRITFCGIPYAKTPVISKSSWTVTATAQYGGNYPAHAADGNLGSGYTTTDTNAGAWLQVEFPVPMKVSQIIHRKFNAHLYTRTVNMEYRVGMTPVTGTALQVITVNEVCGTTPLGTDNDKEYTVVCSEPLFGKYLTVQQKSNFQLWEVGELEIE